MRNELRSLGAVVFGVAHTDGLAVMRGVRPHAVLIQVTSDSDAVRRFVDELKQMESLSEMPRVATGPEAAAEAPFRAVRFHGTVRDPLDRESLLATLVPLLFPERSGGVPATVPRDQGTGAR